MNRDQTRRATARDVALLAEVSVATVSLIANGKSAGRVTPKTHRRVLDAIQKLDYRVNTTASALARGRRDTVAFVSPDPTNPFFAHLLDGMASVLNPALSLTALWPRHGDDYDAAAVHRALAGDLAGLVLACPDRALLEAISPTCPTILLDPRDGHPGMSRLDLDLTAGSVALAEHLIGLGHRKVAYVGIGNETTALHHRRNTLCDELISRGASVAVPDLIVPRMTVHSALENALDVLPAWIDAGVTAVVCGDDLLAYGILQAAEQLSIAVPTTLSVVGHNNLPFSAMVTPSLTTVDLSARDIGIRAGRMLNEMVLGGDPPPREAHSTHLIARASTGLARA
jgi:LacI family transcriptional regulator